MIDPEEIIDRLNKMPPDKVEEMVIQALKESNIPYTYGDEGIKFDGLAFEKMEEN